MGWHMRFPLKNNRLTFNTELTNVCDMVCGHCPHSVYGEVRQSANSFTRPKGFMSPELHLEVVKSAETSADQLLYGFFGEPLLHPRFKELVEQVPNKRSYEYVINTNWSQMSTRQIEPLLHFDHVRVSLDTLDADLYDRICPGPMVRDWDGIKSKKRHSVIVEKLKRWLAIESRPSTSIVFVTTAHNQSERSEFVDYWRPLLGPNDFILQKTVLSYGGVFPENATSQKGPCKLKKRPFLTISWDGRCSPCNLDVDIQIGSLELKNYPSIEGLLQSNDWGAAIKSIQTTAPICETCTDHNNWTENTQFFKDKVDYHRSNPKGNNFATRFLKKLIYD